MNVTTRRVVNIYKTQKLFHSTKRKYPINPKLADQLPIYDYPVSKTSYNRVFVWGCTLSGALGVPYKTKQKVDVESIGHPKRHNFAEHNEVTAVGCGFGFTVFAVNSPSIKLYGTGLNTDSQIGYHEVQKDKPLDVIYFPQPIYLPLENPKKTQVRKVAGGRAHLLVLTDEGLFTLGNNVYGQCGRQIVANEKYSGSKFIHQIDKIDGKSITDVECGQDHSIILTDDGCVYSCGWGADGQTGLGHFDMSDKFCKIEGEIAGEKIVKVAARSDFNLALNDKGDIFGWGNSEYAQLPDQNDKQQVNTPIAVNLNKSMGTIVDVGTGGTFCAVVNDKGEVFLWGFGILGTGPSVQHSKVPIQVPSVLFGHNDFQPDSKVIKIFCGVNHICAVTNKGDLYTWGRNKSRCLGLGNEKDQYFPLRVSLGGVVTYVRCGLDHTVALCKPFI